MKTYKITKRPLCLSSGVVKLTSDQASKRSRYLACGKKKDEYNILGEVQFKVGEYVGLTDKVAHGMIKNRYIVRHDTQNTNK